MTSVDFSAWAAPGLDLTLGGRTYTVAPPSVARGRQITALAVRAELAIGLVRGEMPTGLAEVIEQIATEPLGVVTLGSGVYEQMVADALPALDIDRAAYYALHYWARGKAQADWLADLMWGERPEQAGEAAPKAPRRRRSRSGRSTASASQTKTGTTPTTGSPQT